jgi:CDP-diacylglycerol--glycerol-3-phosphate 3-phosphatidyltransferase
VILVVPVVIFTLHRTNVSDWVAFSAFVVAALTDGLDGWAARKMDLVSSAGQLWDPIADKVLVTAAMVGLVVVGRFPAWAAGIIIGREVAVTALRFAASARGRGFPASKAGKAKTGAQLVAVLLFLLPVHGAWRPVEWTWLGIALLLTVVSALDYFRRVPKLLKS